MGHPACAVRRLRLGDWLVPLQKTGERDPAFRHTDERPVDVHRRPAEPRGCRRAWGVFHVLDGFRHSAERGALLYLVIFGAIIAYTCYFWLLLHTRTVVAISYEYVNPVIGVFLGWLLAGEQVDGVIVTACCLTVLSVFFIVSRKHG
ncbi:MAG: EamA family transporter [Bilophila wadsworthia]